MWQLRFEQIHKDCLYTPKLEKLGLTMFGYPLNHFQDKKGFHINGLQILSGDARDISAYIRQLRAQKAIHRLERVSDNALMFQSRIAANIAYYATLYNPRIFYPAPIIHQNGKELMTLASFDRKLLTAIIESIEQNQNTAYFKFVFLKQAPTQSIFLPQILPRLTSHQRKIVGIAKAKGYWDYPRKTTMEAMADELSLAKSTLHETLRRAESRVMKFFI